MTRSSFLSAAFKTFWGVLKPKYFHTTDLTIAPVKYISYSAVVSELAKGTFVSTNMYNAEIVCELTKATQLLKAAPERKITS